MAKNNLQNLSADTCCVITQNFPFVHQLFEVNKKFASVGVEYRKPIREDYSEFVKKYKSNNDETIELLKEICNGYRTQSLRETCQFNLCHYLDSNCWLNVLWVKCNECNSWQRENMKKCKYCSKLNYQSKNRKNYQGGCISVSIYLFRRM